MNKILGMTLGLMLSLSLVSASYDYEWERPNLDVFTNPIFYMSQVLGSMNQYVQLAYGLLTASRQLENQIIIAEARIKRLEARSCHGSSKTNTVTITETITETVVLTKEKFDAEYGRKDCSTDNDWCSRADMNKDGEVDTTDLVIFASQ